MASTIGRLYGGRGGRIIQGDFSSLQKMAGQLSRLAIGNQGHILAAGMESATKVIKNDAKARLKPGAGEMTGALKKAMDNKVKIYQDGGAVLGLIGPRTGAYATGAAVQRIKKNSGESGFEYRKRTKGMAQPSKYAHLVEFGHRSVHGGGAVPNMGAKVKGVWNSVNKNRSIRKGTIGATSYVPPVPFLRPAFDGGINALENTLADATRKAMEAEFSKLR
jgi:hypothetical protein